MVTDVKEAITNKPIEILGRLVDASNATLFGVLAETEINVIYKPISGERPLWDFEEGSLAGREVAAYLTSEFMDFNLVPFTTLREGPFGLGMVQHWIEVDESFEIIEFSHQNPVYKISYKNCTKPIIGFSKLYDDSHNKRPFIAITTCSNAEENCPFIPDAVERFHLPFTDPKISDGTKLQAEAYLKTNKQIAGEIYFIFEMIKKSI